MDERFYVYAGVNECMHKKTPGKWGGIREWGKWEHSADLCLMNNVKPRAACSVAGWQPSSVLRSDAVCEYESGGVHVEPPGGMKRTNDAVTSTSRPNLTAHLLAFIFSMFCSCLRVCTFGVGICIALPKMPPSYYFMFVYIEFTWNSHGCGLKLQFL